MRGGYGGCGGRLELLVVDGAGGWGVGERGRGSSIRMSSSSQSFGASRSLTPPPYSVCLSRCGRLMFVAFVEGRGSCLMWQVEVGG